MFVGILVKGGIISLIRTDEDLSTLKYIMGALCYDDFDSHADDCRIFDIKEPDYEVWSYEGE